MFKTIANKGFQLTFQNGWTVSVVFGYGSYSENRDMGLSRPVDYRNDTLTSKDAEIGVWYQNGSIEVRGWCSANDVALAIEEVSKLEGEVDIYSLKCLNG